MRLKEITRNPNFCFLFFFIFLFLYYLLIYNSYLYYHYHQPIFLFDKTFLQEFLLYPGGPLEWITQFLLQFFYFNLLGSLIIAALSVSIFIIFYKLIEKIGNFKYSLILAFLPVILLLIIQNRYDFPLVITVKYLFAIIFFFIYVKIPERYKTFIILLSCLIYYILGGWAYLFYVVLCVLHELLFREDRKKYIYAGLNVLVYFIYPYVSVRYLFTINFKEAYLYIVPYELYYAPFLFKASLYFYLFFLSLPVLQTSVFVHLKYIKSKIKKQNKSLVRFPGILAQSIFIILAGVIILAFSFDRIGKKKIQIDYLAEQGQWKELLDLSQEVDKYDRFVNFNVNRALYHTGQLLDNLFEYPQLLGADGLFIDKIIASQIAIPASDLYFDLGHINASQVMAYEGQTKFKYNPRILKRLALTNIINGKYVVAEKFLNLLNKSILHKKWVKHYQSYLFDKSLIKSDSLIQLKRKQKPEFDFFIANKNPNLDLIKLLEENENNKMAFEYLMAYYLLECRLRDLLEHLTKFKELGYREFPRHIEEALLLVKPIFQSKNIMIERSINPQTIKQFEQFYIIISKSKNEVEAKKALTEEFHNTYWYYVRYINPKRTKLELKRRKIDEDIF